LVWVQEEDPYHRPIDDSNYSGHPDARVRNPDAR
jgi:hypothetical protein